MENKKIKKIITLSVLISLACCLSYFDSYICSFIQVGALRYKLGLANIVIMVIMYNYSFKEGIISVIIKSLIVGFLFGASGIITFVMSFLGSIISYLGMYFIKKVLLDSKFTPFIGLIGGFLHPVGQILGAIIIYGFKDFFMASLITTPMMLILGIITGLIVGLTTKQINKVLENKIN